MMYPTSGQPVTYIYTPVENLYPEPPPPYPGFSRSSAPEAESTIPLKVEYIDRKALETLEASKLKKEGAQNLQRQKEKCSNLFIKKAIIDIHRITLGIFSNFTIRESITSIKRASLHILSNLMVKKEIIDITRDALGILSRVTLVASLIFATPTGGLSLAALPLFLALHEASLCLGTKSRQLRTLSDRSFSENLFNVLKDVDDADQFLKVFNRHTRNLSTSISIFRISAGEDALKDYGFITEKTYKKLKKLKELPGYTSKQKEQRQQEFLSLKKQILKELPLSETFRIEHRQWLV